VAALHKNQPLLAKTGPTVFNAIVLDTLQGISDGMKEQKAAVVEIDAEREDS
jgi:hypothetical protein